MGVNCGKHLCQGKHDCGSCDQTTQGKWILEKDPNGESYCFHCSVCDSDFKRTDIKTKYPYCPNCGAKMEA